MIGCLIILLDINEPAVDELCQNINKEEILHKAVAFRCDVTSESEVVSVCARIKREIGNPTMLINNAGIVAGKYFQDLEYKDFVKTFNVNVLSNVLLVKQFLPNMLENNHGHIVSVSSILALKGLAGVSEYCSSKAAAATFMSSIRYEIDLLGNFLFLILFYDLDNLVKK